ncbi:MAG: LolA family protein [Planctomycetota bacterium]
MHDIEQSPQPVRPPCRLRFIHSKTFKWIIPAAAAAAIMLIVGFWPSKSPNGIAWADVIQQILTARSAHLHMTIREPEIAGGNEVIIDTYLKSTDKMRQDFPQPQYGGQSIIVNGHKQITLIASSKLWQIASNYEFSEDFVQKLLNQYFTLPDKPENQIPNIIGQDSFKLVFQNTEEQDGNKLLKYALEYNKPQDQLTAEESSCRMYYWFDIQEKTLVLMTKEQIVNGTPVVTTSATVKLNVDLPDSLFSTEVPPGYQIASKVGVSQQVSKAIREVSAHYEHARNATKRYRLIKWESTKNKLYHSVRSIRDGKQIRVDGLQAKLSQYNPDFETVWKQVKVSPHGNTLLTYKGRMATIRRLTSGIRSEWSEDPNLACNLLKELGWPEWPGGGLISLLKPEYKYQRLPDRQDLPGLIGIRAESNFKSKPQPTIQVLKIFWIDPEKDYLCVRHEVHQRQGKPWENNLEWIPSEHEDDFANMPKEPYGEYDNVIEITEFGQTPDGRWYPKILKHTGGAVINSKRYTYPLRSVRIQLDVTGPVPEELFDWPANVPKPK